MSDDRMTEQTAMERFRAALEKRGIEFDTDDDECAEGEARITVFKANLGDSEDIVFVAAKEWYYDGRLTPWLDVEFHNTLTPEQAVAATLGSETCEVKYHNIDYEGNADEWTCLACGERWIQNVDWPKACPYCGKAVKQ